MSKPALFHLVFPVRGSVKAHASSGDSLDLQEGRPSGLRVFSDLFSHGIGGHLSLPSAPPEERFWAGGIPLPAGRRDQL
jgi:extradiol dioxygenase family protein